jgi:hypothetical protein
MCEQECRAAAFLGRCRPQQKRYAHAGMHTAASEGAGPERVGASWPGAVLGAAAGSLREAGAHLGVLGVSEALRQAAVRLVPPVPRLRACSGSIKRSDLGTNGTTGGSSSSTATTRPNPTSWVHAVARLRRRYRCNGSYNTHQQIADLCVSRGVIVKEAPSVALSGTLRHGPAIGRHAQ